MIFFFC